MVATAAKKAIDSLIGREAPTTDLERRWVDRARELSVGPDGFVIAHELQVARIEQRVQAALAATPAVEFHLLELLTLDANLPGSYVAAIRQRLITPDRALVRVTEAEQAALFKLTRHTTPARFTITRYNDQRGSSWSDPVTVPLATLAETFLRLQATIANLRQDQATAAAETATSATATALVGERVKAELVAVGVWPMLKQRNPIAVQWFTSADGFATWAAPFTTPLASADGLRSWLTRQAQTEKGGL